MWKRCACAPGKPPGQPSAYGYADGRERQRYKLGQRVRHAKFGEGTIVNRKAAASIAVCRWHSRARVLNAGGGLRPTGDGIIYDSVAGWVRHTASGISNLLSALLHINIQSAPDAT